MSYSIIFQVKVGMLSCLPGLNQLMTKQRIKCLAKEHNTVTPVSLEH